MSTIKSTCENETHTAGILIRSTIVSCAKLEKVGKAALSRNKIDQSGISQSLAIYGHLYKLLLIPIEKT